MLAVIFKTGATLNALGRKISEIGMNIFGGSSSENISSPVERLPFYSSSPKATESDIYYCFRLLLGRNPQAQDWAAHLWRVGEELSAVVATFVSSLEFSLRGLGSQNLTENLKLCQLEGFNIYVSTDDIDVGKHIASGSYEPEVVSTFRRIIKPGMGVIDVGANVGYYTMLSASLVGSDGFVLAVEPNAQNMKLLEASRRANSYNHITTAQCAAGRKTGILMLNAAHSNGTTSSLSDDLNAMLGAQSVASFRLDDIVPRDRNIDFIKIDVEGAEYNALLGGRETLMRCRPVIVSEFSPEYMPGISGIDGEGYLRFLIEMGYQISVIERDASLTNCQSDITAVMNIYRGRSIDHIDILAQPA